MDEKILSNPNSDYACQGCGNMDAIQLRKSGVTGRYLCEDCEYQETMENDE